MAKQSKTYYRSPLGVAVYPHITKPDTKFNDDGLFKVSLRLEGKDAETMKARLDAAAEAAFKDFMENGDGADLKPGEQKKFSVYKPYVEEEDDEGNPTGSILVQFKQNAVIKLRDGTVKHVQIGIYDADNKPAPNVDIWGGSVIRVKFAMRDIVMKSLKQVGVRLDFSLVQVKKLATGGQGDSGFDAIEDEDAFRVGDEGGFSEEGSKSAPDDGEDF